MHLPFPMGSVGSAQATQPNAGAPQLVLTKCSQWLLSTSQQGLLSSVLSQNIQPVFQPGVSGYIAPCLCFYFTHSGPIHLHVPLPQGKRAGQKMRSGKVFHKSYKMSRWKTKIWCRRGRLETPQPCNVYQMLHAWDSLSCANDSQRFQSSLRGTTKLLNFFSAPAYLLPWKWFLLYELSCFAYYCLCSSVCITPTPTKNSWHVSQPSGKFIVLIP